jgi:hypothetical protein
MAQAARKQTTTWTAAPARAAPTPATSPFALADESSQATPSPALALQAQLAAAFAAAPEPDVAAYPPAVRLAALGTLTVGCWAGVFAVGRLALTLLAHR